VTVDARELYDWVEEFSALGVHRVGTDVDRATIEWFADRLTDLGGRVERRPFAFDRYDATSTVEIDGRAVPSDVLYYEGIGTVTTDRPHVGSAAVMAGDRPSPGLLDAITAARATGAEVAVIATEHPAGELQVPNRHPVLGSGLPVVLVPGREADALRTGPVRVDFGGRIVPGESANVVAAFGRTSARPVVLATPLSGWFTCAAERATGIAVLLGLVERLAGAHPLLVVGASAHELLHHVGLQAYLAGFDVDAALIVHLGANLAVAVRDPDSGALALAPGIAHSGAIAPAGRAAFARMDADAFRSVADALAGADLHPVLDPPQFLGEGAVWASASPAPLLSFVGVSPLFHTPADTPPNATCPDGLAIVSGAVGDAVEAFLDESAR